MVINEVKTGGPTLWEMIVIIISTTLVTLLMGYLDAYERLYIFTQMYEFDLVAEFAVFFPAFLAMGFVIFSVRRIQELQSEIQRRRQTEAALLESEKRYRELSLTDALTRLNNARHFFSRLRSEIDRADRFSQDLSMLLLDIDDFKKYNDNYGHLEGDKVLSSIGDAIRACLRSTDSAYRYGGEEFTVILPGTQGQGAAVVAERIRETFKNTAHRPGNGKEVHLTVSIGVAQYTPGERENVLIDRADKNMYEAKRLGKDRVFFSI